jgi:hypothetical protein
LHLLEWIEVLIEGRLDVTIVHPTGRLDVIPEGAAGQEVPGGSGAWDRLLFEQRRLPSAATRLDCSALLVSAGSAPIRSKLPVIALGGAVPDDTFGGLMDKLRRAFGRAGSVGAALTLLHDDLVSMPDDQARIPPFVFPAFAAQTELIPLDYVLCFGIRYEDVPIALASWTWVDGSLGDTYPLLFAGCSAQAELRIRAEARELDVSESIEFKTQVSRQDLPSLYANAAALLSVSFNAWGQPLRWALAAGVPVAGMRTAQAASIVQEAGYLVAAGDTRALGAACLSLLVQEDLADKLRAKGKQIAHRFSQAGSREQILALIRDAAGGRV